MNLETRKNVLRQFMYGSSVREIAKMSRMADVGLVTWNEPALDDREVEAVIRDRISEVDLTAPGK